MKKDEIIFGKVDNQENTVAEAMSTFLGGRDILVKCRQEVSQDKDEKLSATSATRLLSVKWLGRKPDWSRLRNEGKTKK